jgi:hypothetical protein
MKERIRQLREEYTFGELGEDLVMFFIICLFSWCLYNILTWLL